MMNRSVCVGTLTAFLFFSTPLLFGSVQWKVDELRGQGMVVHQEYTSPEPFEPQVAFPGEFDLEGCEQDCRSKFGVDPYFVGGGSGMDTSVWRLFSICIQNCNRDYWKDYDRRMKRLGDPEKDEE